MNLVPAIKGMVSKMNSVKLEYQAKINDLENGLTSLRKLNTVCEKCEGKKTIMRPRSCAEDDREREQITCPECHGTGRTKTPKEASQ